jgi:hypothetical protein
MRDGVCEFSFESFPSNMGNQIKLKSRMYNVLLPSVDAHIVETGGAIIYSQVKEIWGM